MQGLEKEFYIKSSATSSEEIGNDIHYGTRDKLIQRESLLQKKSRFDNWLYTSIRYKSYI